MLIADQTNLRVTMETQCAQVQANYWAWLEVNQYHKDPAKTVPPANETTSISNGSATHNFPKENARIFTCMSDVVAWCEASPSSKLAPPPALANADRVQVLMTGSLYLVGAAMSVLGCTVDGL